MIGGKGNPFAKKSAPPMEDADAAGGEEAASDEGVDQLSAMAGKKAAGKVLAAIDSGDATALDAALRAHYSACEGMG